MKELKIYLTLKETESLIFNRLLLVERNRLNIVKAQGLYSIDIKLDNEYLIERGNQYLILFSAIKLFEIPEKEETLFLNHYKLPPGLIQLISRTVRDEDNVGQKSMDEELGESENHPYYLQFRNALLCLFEDSISNVQLPNYSIEIIKSFTALSDFKSHLIMSVLDESRYPVFKVKTADFKPEMFFRYTWWGKFIIDNLLEPKKNQLEELEIEYHKKWFKEFSDPTNFLAINKALTKIPELYKSEVDYLLGYYVAAMNFEKSTTENFKQDLKEYISNLEIKFSEDLLQWAIFFQAILREELVYLFLIPSLRLPLFTIERLAFDLANNEFNNVDFLSENIELINISKEDQITEYVQLSKGGEKVAPDLIKQSEVKDIFNNKLSKGAIGNIGLVLKSSFESNNYFYNTCSFMDNEFQLNLSKKPSEVIFYSSSDTEARDYLKELKIKQKPIKTLFNKKKRVLVGFPRENNLGLIKLYAHLLQSENSFEFEKFVFVWLVNRETENIQSTEFDMEKKEMETRLSTILGNPVTMIIKNIKITNDVEIKRNLKNLLGEYRINQLEVIDENFDAIKARWILDGSKDYFVEEKGRSTYYSFFNN